MGAARRPDPVQKISKLHLHNSLRSPFATPHQTADSTRGGVDSSVDWDNHLPQPARYAVLDAPQDTVGPFGCHSTLLTHIQLAINPNHQISFHRAALQPLVLQFVCMSQECEQRGLRSVKKIGKRIEEELGEGSVLLNWFSRE